MAEEVGGAGNGQALVTVPVDDHAETFIENALKRFEPFLATNPLSSIAEVETTDDKIVVISDPWGDPSLVIAIPEKSDGVLEEALNNAYLPERYTAIYHRDTKNFEIIWTAYPLSSDWRDIPGRVFQFSLSGKTYECTFAESSERLLAIAQHFRPVTASGTFFRNLDSFRMHTTLRQRKKDDPTLPEPHTIPRSFWVKDVEWDENLVLTLINNLNFYLTYYDAQSTHVIIHSPRETALTKPQTRYIAGKFPGRIDARPLDDILIQMWFASRKGDEATRFLYGFRILEYASTTYLDGKARTEIRKILAAAHALDNLSATTEQVVSALQKTELADYGRCEALLVDTVRPELLWREINHNVKAFTETTNFDGGFELKAMIATGLTEAQFATKGVQNFHRSVRDIRNALAHGKDTKTAGVIAPTVRNFGLLRPWLSLLSVAAGEVILLKNVI